VSVTADVRARVQAAVDALAAGDRLHGEQILLDLLENDCEPIDNPARDVEADLTRALATRKGRT